MKISYALEESDKGLEKWAKELGPSVQREAIQPWLLELQDDTGGRRVPLVAGHSVLGSSAAADIVLQDPTVSPRHCALRIAPEGVWVEDIGSQHGTFVGSARIQSALAGVGTTLVLGRSTVMLASGVESYTAETNAPALEGIAGSSLAMRRVAAQVRRLASHAGPVLILGESGTGKELIARALHQEGPRAGRPFLVLNVAALPRELVESELFGHERGSFTGAVSKHLGAFFEAEGGTLFLDEIGELPLEAQPKLLRALDGYAVRHVGGAGPGKRVHVRIVAATHVPLDDRIHQGLFRNDLFHRLATFVLKLPPLRERRVDIGPIARKLLRELAEEFGPRELTPLALARLVAHEWTGNVRELRNVLSRAADLTEGKRTIDVRDVDSAIHMGEEWKPMALTPHLAQQLLAQCHNNVSAAARAAGCPRTSFRKLLYQA